MSGVDLIPFGIKRTHMDVNIMIIDVYNIKRNILRINKQQTSIILAMIILVDKYAYTKDMTTSLWYGKQICKK